MLNVLSTQHFRGDLTGGLTAAIVSLPMALAFGIASGAGAEAGLYGAMLVGLFASLFGGTPTLISEPTGPMTVVMAAVITSMMAQNPENGLAMAFSVVVIAGLFQVLMGVFKLGKYITLMPYSVVSGFMSGIGLILIILHIGPLLGTPAQSGGALNNLAAIPDMLSAANLTEALFAFGALLVLFFYPAKWKRYAPPQLIALIAFSVLSVMLLTGDELRRIGEINVAIPSFQMPVFSADQIKEIILDGIVLGMLGCIDSMLSSIIADNLTGSHHKSDKELVGQGLGNIASGLFGGLPGAGATMGTVVNIQSGGRTHLSGVIRVMVLAIAVYGLASLLELVPIAVLAAIAVKVGVDILDWSFIKRAHRVSWQTTLVMYSVLTLTVLVDLIVAVGVGIFVANIMIIEKLRVAQQDSIRAISDIDDATPLSQEERALLNEAKGEILLVYLSGPMIFALTKTLSKQSAEITRQKVVILDLSDVPMMDDTMLLAMENTIRELSDKGKHVYLVVRNPKLREKFDRLGTLALLKEGCLSASRLDVLKDATRYLQDHSQLKPVSV